MLVRTVDGTLLVTFVTGCFVDSDGDIVLEAAENDDLLSWFVVSIILLVAAGVVVVQIGVTGRCCLVVMPSLVGITFILTAKNS